MALFVTYRDMTVGSFPYFPYKAYIKAKSLIKFEDMKLWNYDMSYILLDSPIEDYHNIKRIIEIGSVLMEYDLVEIYPKCLISLW